MRKRSTSAAASQTGSERSTPASRDDVVTEPALRI
jgi:hypothetical protein